MAKYNKVDVSEQQLEDLVRQHTHDIEEGLSYVDHQKQTDTGRLDVLLVDSGKALVLVELKVVEDDGMLLQAVDYYDYVSSHIEAFARLYKKHSIDPTQQVRLFLIAPRFSQTLINRCKWIDIIISLYSYTCLKFQESNDVIPVFSEQTIPSLPEIIERRTVEDILSYVTDTEVWNRVMKLMDDVKKWNAQKITMNPLKEAISMKISGRVFAYLYPRRKHFIVATYNTDDKWTEYAIHGKDDIEHTIQIVKASMDRRTR